MTIVEIFAIILVLFVAVAVLGYFVIMELSRSERLSNRL